MTKDMLDSAIGAAILGLYAGIKSAEKAGYDPKMLYEVVAEHIRNEKGTGDDKQS